MNISEIRNWLLFIFSLVGAFLAIKTFIDSTKQRKIENTYKTLSFIRTHITEKQIQTFIKLFQANNPIAGNEFDEFTFNDGSKDSIESMFSEGGCGNGDIHNMIELFDLISPTMGKLESNIIWYEYGQMMLKIYGWTNYMAEKQIIPSEYEFYSKFNEYMRRNQSNSLKHPIKYYTYVE